MINTNTIRTDLIYFLKTFGFSEKELSFIETESRLGQSFKHIGINNIEEELRRKIIYEERLITNIYNFLRMNQI